MITRVFVTYISYKDIMKLKRKLKTMLSAVLSAALLFGALPSMPALAAQSNDYTDPADNWYQASGKTNELDLNSTITYETFYCSVCERETMHMNYRVPEYTRSGETALNRGVRYSDGTLEGGEGKGNLDDGTPGVDAFFTGYHWTKAVCQVCGTFNTVEGRDIYNFSKNVFALYPCDESFFIDYDNTTHEPYNDRYHTTVWKEGEYCQFCKGTFAQASEEQEPHNFDEVVDAQLGNSRFYVAETCDECGYETSEYVTAKSVVASYYGEVDGKCQCQSKNVGKRRRNFACF